MGTPGATLIVRTGEPESWPPPTSSIPNASPQAVSPAETADWLSGQSRRRQSGRCSVKADQRCLIRFIFHSIHTPLTWADEPSSNTPHYRPYRDDLRLVWARQLLEGARGGAWDVAQV